MTHIHRLALAATLIALASPAFAESSLSAIPVPATASTAAASTPHAGAGAYQNLPPGDQKIAHALFEAQRPTATGPAPLSLNQIAARKTESGWGDVFKAMKSEGLVSARNLGQIIGGPDHHVRRGGQKSGAAKTVITNGSGQTFALNAANGERGHVGDDTSGLRGNGNTRTTSPEGRNR